MIPIGGYPELELHKGEHYHKDAIMLNTARNCLEYILIARQYKKIYVPYYTCEAVFEPFKKSTTGFPEMVFYHIDLQLDPTELFELKDGEAFLYTNYFGLKQETLGKLVEKYGNKLIVDNSQAFYDMPYPGIDTFYSARKFFGVPDGAYLYTDVQLGDNSVLKIETDHSYHRMDALLKRIDLGAETAYSDFQNIESQLCFQPIKKMSKLTKSILSSINYESVREQRRSNYIRLYRKLFQMNKLRLKFNNEAVPLSYPYWSDTKDLRTTLIKDKIFVPLYWPNIYDFCVEDKIEYQLAKHILPLPIDQRYDKGDMDKISSLIRKYEI